jgi:hypothetical protein
MCTDKSHYVPTRRDSQLTGPSTCVAVVSAATDAATARIQLPGALCAAIVARECRPPIPTLKRRCKSVTSWERTCTVGLCTWWGSLIETNDPRATLLYITRHGHHFSNGAPAADLAAKARSRRFQERGVCRYPLQLAENGMMIPSKRCGGSSGC